MSTRKLTLLTTAAALALTGGVTAAGVSLAAPPPPPPDGMGTPSTMPSTMPSAPASPSASPPASPSGTASPGKDDAALEECRDAECDVEIKDGQEITLDDEFGVDSIRVEVSGRRVKIVIRARNSRAMTTMDAGGPNSSASFNGITLRPHMTKDGKVMLNISRT